MFRSISWYPPALVIMALACPLVGILPGDGRRCDAAEAELTLEEIIRRALDNPVKFEAIERPLFEVVDDLARQAGVPNVQFDNRALDDVGISSHVPVTGNLNGISLRNVLRLVLRDLDLTFVIRDEVLLITTHGEAETSLQLEIFDVLDLVRLHDDTPPEEYDYDTLIELITTTVAPTTWVDAGGPGPIDGFRGTLVVSQTREILDEIRPLLEVVRKAKQITRENGKQTPPVTSLLASPPRVEAIDVALSKRGDYEYQEEPLQGVVDDMQEKFEIPIRIDIRALDDVGIGDDTPVTFSATDLSLRQVLRLILRDLDLTFKQYCGVLLITTPEEAEAQLETRVYPVGDLVTGILTPPAGGRLDFGGGDYDALIELSTSAVAPTTWSYVGGSGSFEPLPAFGLCVASQTEHVHEEIEELFARLRKQIPRKNMAAEEGDGSGLRLVVYFVGSKPEAAAAPAPNATPPTGKKPDDGNASTNRVDGSRVLAQMGGGMGGMGGGGGWMGGEMFEEDELLELIMELVEPDSWDAEGIFARAVAGRLIIRQTDDVHRQIRRMLNRLGVAFYDSSQGQGAMPGFGGGFFGGGMGGMGMGGGFGGGGGFF